MNEHESISYRVKFPAGTDGINLVGIVDRPKSWDESQVPRPRPVAVYSHCFTCNKDLKATVRISRALARSGVAVLRFDMTGLGGSEGDFSTTNFSTNLLDLAAAIRFADSELGPVTALIGHSFGGVASLVMAAKAADGEEDFQLGDLGCVATIAAPSDTHHLASLLVRMNPEIESRGLGSVSIGGIPWTIQKQMLDDFRFHDITAWLPKIGCPVMLLHSPVDETVGIDHAIRLMTLIQTDRSSDASNITPVSLVSLPGADHLLANNPADLTLVSRLLSAWCHRF